MPGARHCPASQRSPSCDENQAAMAHVGCGVLWIQVCETWFPESGLKLRCRPWLVRLLSNDSPDGSFRENCKDKLADWVAAWLREETCEFEPVVREVLHISVLAFPILDDTESCRPEHLHLPVVSV